MRFTWCLAAAAISLACNSSRSPASPTAAADVAAIRRVAVLGDSLAVFPSRDQSFPAQLQARIDREGLGWTVVNAGITGDTTADGVRRMSDVFAAGIEVLIVELGANDGLRGVAATAITDNLSSIVTAAERRGIRVLLCGMETPPTYGLSYSIAFHFVFPDLAQKLAVPLVPFLLAGIALDPAFTGPDGVHPNAEGARRIAETVWPYLLPLLQQPRSSQPG